jgi:hypothetical protein
MEEGPGSADFLYLIRTSRAPSAPFVHEKRRPPKSAPGMARSHSRLFSSTRLPTRLQRDCGDRRRRRGLLVWPSPIWAPMHSACQIQLASGTLSLYWSLRRSFSRLRPQRWQLCQARAPDQRSPRRTPAPRLRRAPNLGFDRSQRPRRCAAASANTPLPMGRRETSMTRMTSPSSQSPPQAPTPCLRLPV